MKVFLTGATSFTGCHIARALVEAGHTVYGSLTRRLIHYSDPLVQVRREYSQISHWVEEAPTGSDRLLDFLNQQPVDVFVNHGADIKGYRNPDFDFLASVRTGVHRVRETCEALSSQGCRRLIHSGSIFEPDEGDQTAVSSPAPSSEAVSIYGVSKRMVWEPWRFFAVRSGLHVSKIIIPNPIGPFENPDRLIPFFVQTWKKGGVPVVRTPHLVRDHLPASWLANVYLAEAEKGSEEAFVSVRRPSAYAVTNEEFLRLFVKNFEHLLDKTLSFEVAPQLVKEPQRRVNTEPVPEYLDPAQRDVFWEQWAESIGRW